MILTRRCRAFGLNSLARANYRVYCFDCRWEERVRTKARAQRAGNQHLREMRRGGAEGVVTAPVVEVKRRDHRPKWASPLFDVRVDGDSRGVVIELTTGGFEAWREGCCFDSPYATRDAAVAALTNDERKDST